MTRLQFWKLSGNAGAVAILAGLLVSGLPYMARATVVDCRASKDTTIFQANTSASNGIGDWFAAGKNNNGQIQRALIQFDLSAIPANADITSATVELYVIGVPKSESVEANPPLPRSFWLKPISGIGEPSWGEGTSVAGASGQGAPAALGDATWLRKQYPSVSWPLGKEGAVGNLPLDPNGLGDCDGTVPATVEYAPNPPLPLYLTSGHILSEVQQWVRWTEANDGWAVIGEETSPTGSSRRQFASRENNNAAYRPLLRVEYTAPSAPGTLVWSGSSGGLWTADANWGGETAAADSYLQFGPSGVPFPMATENDFAPGAPFRSLTFTADASAYVLQGNRIRLSGPISNLSAGTQAIDFDVELVSGGGTFGDQGGTLSISGAVSGNGPLLKTGSGTLVLSHANSYTGGTTVSEGMLVVSDADALPAGHGLMIYSATTVVLESGLSSAAATGGATAVPEPHTLVLAAVALLAGAMWVLPRRSR